MDLGFNHPWSDPTGVVGDVVLIRMVDGSLGPGVEGGAGAGPEVVVLGRLPRCRSLGSGSGAASNRPEDWGDDLEA